MQQTSCEPFFPDVQMRLKMYVFVPLYANECISIMVVEFQEVMHADCVWPIIMDAELHATCPGERVLVIIDSSGLMQHSYIGGIF